MIIKRLSDTLNTYEYERAFYNSKRLTIWRTVVLIRFKEEWASNVRRDVLSGMTVAFALIPEAIGFALVVGVNPMVALYASFAIAVVISITGGRMGMISAATGSTALLMVTLMKAHGVNYIFAATILTGILQFIMGLLKVGRLMMLVPHAVITGFLNALAIVIFLAQVPELRGAPWISYAMIAATLLIIYGLPRFTRIVPSPLVAIVVMTALAAGLGLHLKNVGDLGHLTHSLPTFRIPDVPFDWKTLQIIFPYAFSIAVVGSLETLLTAQVVDEMTDTGSNKHREIRGQGIANFVAGFLGAMAGCAMIGQTIINVRSGGRRRLSTFVAGAFLLILIVGLGSVVQDIPIAALVGVMFSVSINTFEWASLRELSRSKLYRMEAVTMVLTVVVVVATNNLALGVFTGVLLSMFAFVFKISRLHIEGRTDENGKTYIVSGQMFFATSMHFTDQFDVAADPDHIRIDFTRAHVWDHSSAKAISTIVSKYQRRGKTVTLIGLNDESCQIVQSNEVLSPLVR